jgi:photosystem II stability/assembly factor-like uncharacterized protein
MQVLWNLPILDIDVNPANTIEFYVAYASGGLWYTKNNGTTFTPIFDNNVVMTIGAFAVHWPSHTIYVGTGEANSSRSSYAGFGIYKSTDNGKSWNHLGLEDSHHIGQLWINPNDQNHVIVCALGHLYSSNVQRGIYTSIDGGSTWKQSLYIDDKTGAVDLIQDLANTSVLYASTWHRERRAWNFVESGTTSSIFKSIDGGLTWIDIAKSGSGFPGPNGRGRIGLTMSKKEDSTYLYAVIDNNETRPKQNKSDDSGLLKKADFMSMSIEKFNALKDDDLKKYLEENDFPEKYTVKKIRELINKKDISIASLADYLEDADTAMEDTEIKGAEIFFSTNDGATWTKTHDKNLDGVYYTFGYYFGQIRSNPIDPSILYILGVPILKSIDAGKTWKSINGDNQHGDHHCLWINPQMPNHLINGNDGGINISYDGGESWIKCNMPSVGQFYTVNVDNEDTYNVYGGLQDNGVWYGKHNYKYSNGWQDDGVYPYKFLLGGDGMQVQIDNRDNNTVYAGSQFGNYYRINKKTGEKKHLTPKHDLGEKAYRWNWQSPILLSPHNQDILYMGCNKMMRSMDKGDTFKELSGDLTKGGLKGNVPYGTLTAIDESILKFGLLYTGSDDGLMHVSKDGGNTWTKISEGLPQELWVSKIQASKHLESRVYAALNGYRWDNFSPYLYVSDDYGSNWTNIGTALPNEPINVIKEDLEDKDLLYVGTDHGLYFSINAGQSFMLLGDHFPRVAVHDLALQKKSGHLIVATHGRSLYKIDINPLRKLKEIKDKPLYIYDLKKLVANKNWGKISNGYSDPIDLKTNATVFSQSVGKAKIQLSNSEGKIFDEKEIELKIGIATYEIKWEIRPQSVRQYEEWINKDKKEKIVIKMTDNKKYYPIIGEYKVILIKGNDTMKTDWSIVEKI